jgi:Domain of unknown function (DUF4189)
MLTIVCPSQEMRLMVAACVRSRILLVAALVLASLLLIPHKAVAAAAVAFGQGPNGTWAESWSRNYPDQEAADAEALRRCKRSATNGQQCEIIARFSDKCFALAVTDKDNGYGYAFGDRGEAVTEAITRCMKLGMACTVRESMCEGTAYNAEDEEDHNKYWHTAKLFAGCDQVPKCAPRCMSGIALGNTIYKACMASCQADWLMCTAYQKRDQQRYDAAKASSLKKAGEYQAAIDGYTPQPQQGQNDSPPDIDDLPSVNTTPDQRARGYGGFQ